MAGNVDRKTLNKAGVAALVVLAPGGIILGGLLAWRTYRRRTGASAAKVRSGS